MSKSILELLNPTNCTVILIDHQPQMFFGIGAVDRQMLKNNVVGLAKTAKIFKVPTILTTIAAKSFSGPLIPELQAVYPAQIPIDRTSMNSWEDKNLVDAVKKTNRRKLVIAGLWTEVCVTFPVISAIKDGYEVYVVTDASGATTVEAHEIAIQRMVQAGAVPITWIQFLCELQRDWAREETYEPVMELVKEYGGAYGIGVFYAQSMFGAHGG